LEPIPPLAGGSETAKESHISAQIYMRTKFHQHNPSKRRKKLPKPPFVATSPTSNLAEDFKKSQRRKMEKKRGGFQRRKGANTDKCSTKEPKSTVQSTQTIAEARETPFPAPLKQHRSRRRRRRPEDARRI